MTHRPRERPNSGTYVWYGGSVLIFLIGGITFATDGHILWAVLALVGAAYSVGYLMVARRRN